MTTLHTQPSIQQCKSSCEYLMTHKISAWELVSGRSSPILFLVSQLLVSHHISCMQVVLTHFFFFFFFTFFIRTIFATIHQAKYCMDWDSPQLIKLFQAMKLIGFEQMSSISTLDCLRVWDRWIDLRPTFLNCPNFMKFRPLNCREFSLGLSSRPSLAQKLILECFLGHEWNPSSALIGEKDVTDKCDCPGESWGPD